MGADGSRAAVFLDRDGTLIEDTRYPNDPAQVRLIPGAVDALTRLRERDFALVVVSNQSGIGRGLIRPEEAEAVHDRFVQELASHGVALDGFRYCPHAPDEACECRKPSPAMLLDLATELDLDLAASFIVGDKHSDMEAGRRAGCATVFLGAASDEGAQEADHVAATWDDAAGAILGRSR
jgi:histidinol-phosphate phosphatase family protein